MPRDSWTYFSFLKQLSLPFPVICPDAPDDFIKPKLLSTLFKIVTTVIATFSIVIDISGN